MKYAYFEKLTLLSIIMLFAAISCTTTKEISEVKTASPEPQEQIRKEAPPSEETLLKRKAEPFIEKKKIRCTENTPSVFNLSGIQVLPFIKIAFSDMDSDGLSDMVTGGKGGYLELYKNSGDAQLSHWNHINGYFDGTKVGAFSAPAIGDLDGDGIQEIVVGTGGFSSESGKILVFRNKGTSDFPKWEKIQGQEMKIGDDAAVTVVDYNFDNSPDIIAGNSEGRIFFFRNVSSGENIRFERDRSLAIKKPIDKYVVPAALRLKDKVVLMAGTSMGELYLFEIKSREGELLPKKVKLDFHSARFLSPSFANLLEKDRYDLVLADGDGNLAYYVNKNNNFREWEKDNTLFSDRLVGGPACAPTMFLSEDGICMIVGTIDGNLKFYEYNGGYRGIPWTEKRKFLNGIKLSGFSRGFLASWEGKNMLITGESSGEIRAFINSGTRENPSWKEKKNFFSGVHTKYHSTPTIFDLDNDGKWELITGAEDGRIYAYRVKGMRSGIPQWERITGMFDHVRVQGFSSPSFVTYQKALYLFVGQENGHIRTFSAEQASKEDASQMVFLEKDVLNNITMQTHSSPFVVMNRDKIELISGDYDGNIRHFYCSES
ncbi:MAG: VCBS repeat-containing protein [Nitrospiraceae bacterium]|nr:MAG: VCBS repeat-containing protein [Nitrospiraceae bacterium]